VLLEKKLFVLTKLMPVLLEAEMLLCREKTRRPVRVWQRETPLEMWTVFFCLRAQIVLLVSTQSFQFLI